MKNIVKVNELRRNITIELHNQVTELDSLSLVLKMEAFKQTLAFQIFTRNQRNNQTIQCQKKKNSKHQRKQYTMNHTDQTIAKCGNAKLQAIHHQPSEEIQKGK